MSGPPLLQGRRSEPREGAAVLTRVTDGGSLCDLKVVDACGTCGAALSVVKDEFRCKVCEQVLCVSCLEMQDKLLFMRNSGSPQSSTPSQCPLCSMMSTINGKRHTITANKKEPDTNSKTQRPVSVQKSNVTDSLATESSKVSGTKPSGTNRSKVTSGDSLNTERSEVISRDSPDQRSMVTDTECSKFPHTERSEVISTETVKGVDIDSRAISNKTGYHSNPRVISKMEESESSNVTRQGDSSDGGIVGSLITEEVAQPGSTLVDQSITVHGGQTMPVKVKDKGQVLDNQRSKVSQNSSSQNDESEHFQVSDQVKVSYRGQSSPGQTRAVQRSKVNSGESFSETKDGKNTKEFLLDLDDESSIEYKKQKSVTKKQYKMNQEDKMTTSTEQRGSSYKDKASHNSKEKSFVNPDQLAVKDGKTLVAPNLWPESFKSEDVKGQKLATYGNDEDDFDDEEVEVEYDNLRLKGYNEQGKVLKAMIGSLLGMNSLDGKGDGDVGSNPKMTMLTIVQPKGQGSESRDEYGRILQNQRFEYTNLLVVETDSDETFPRQARGNLSKISSGRQNAVPLPHRHFQGDSQEHDTTYFANEDFPGSSTGPGHSPGDISRTLRTNYGVPSEPSYHYTRHQSVEDGTIGPGNLEGRDQTNQIPKPDGNTPETPPPETVIAAPKRFRKQNKQAFAHACSGCGRRDCQGNFMKLLREMIETAGNSGFEIRNVVPDGNCMFAAIVDQLELRNDFSFSPKSLRHGCLQYLRENPNSGDGTPYVLFLDGETWEEYLSRMSQDGVWGDHMILQAVSKVIARNIQVIHHESKRDWTVIESKRASSDKSEQPSDGTNPSDKSDSLFLGHVGEFHYVSLRPSDLAKQLHSGDGGESDDENYTSMDVFTSLSSLPNLDDPSKQEMFTEEYIDPWSEVPALHLSYILKKFVPMTTTLQSADSMVANAEIMMEEERLSHIKKSYRLGERTSIILIGDAAEGLYAPYLTERERTEFDRGSEWVDVTALLMTNTCIAYPKDHSNVGEMDTFIETDNVHPGYARLLATYPDQWATESGTAGPGMMTTYLPNHHANFNDKFGLTREEKDYNASQNTSVVSFFNKISMAIVAPFWPSEAAEWRTRERKASWPPEHIIDSIVSGGYSFECFPHPKSTNPDIEFRASFGIAEKTLVQEAMSREQRYCFLIFKALCSQEFREEDLITSAHLKSIFFCACEQLPCDIWISRQGACVFYLLDSLFSCIQELNIPDYFIPTNNLIDHLDEAQQRQISQKIMTLRNEPLTSLLKIGQKNYIQNASIILGHVNDDLQKFHEHRSARQSVLDSLVPISIDIAKCSIQSGQYKQALEQLQEAYEERLVVSTCEDSLPFTAFLTQAVNGCTIPNQWWFFFVVDLQLHTVLCADLSMGLQPVALEELVGKDVAQTFVGTLIPAIMAHDLCGFCSDMAVHLFNSYHTQKCLPFLVYNLTRYREKQQTLKSGQQSADVDDFTDENALRFFDQLYIVYNRLNELVFFKDLLPEFEAVCEKLNTKYAFRKLSTILKKMGYTEKSEMAMAKANSIPHESCYHNGQQCY